ncbi:unnamed protein product [Ceratitis capitata]|uniref:(Mediterranean fruit fly) hypothetical protein n=1 Tax=Ceratitis capitata TaxID=7213 RepID=A0A811V9J4_CERCA|nr:unnamed protein product [Ceratitis capitata]
MPQNKSAKGSHKSQLQCMCRTVAANVRAKPTAATAYGGSTKQQQQQCFSSNCAYATPAVASDKHVTDACRLPREGRIVECAPRPWCGICDTAVQRLPLYNVRVHATTGAKVECATAATENFQVTL